MTTANAFGVLIEGVIIEPGELEAWLRRRKLSGIDPGRVRHFTLDGLHTWIVVDTEDDCLDDVAGGLAAFAAKRLSRRTWALHAVETDVLGAEAFGPRGQRRWGLERSTWEEPSASEQRKAKELLAGLGVRANAPRSWLTSPYWRVMKELKTTRKATTPRVDLGNGGDLLVPRGPGWRELERAAPPSRRTAPPRA